MAGMYHHTHLLVVEMVSHELFAQADLNHDFPRASHDSFAGIIGASHLTQLSD
jgi:hypothetical protein